MRIKGDEVYHSSLYFAPMLITYLGLRRAEAAGWAVADIVKEDGIWAIKIRANSIRGVKNLRSARSVPVPEELLRLGFIDYVYRLKELNHSSLFPELMSPSSKANPGDRFYKTFVPLMKAEREVAAQLWARTIHAFRHGFSNTLKQQGVEISTIEDITGHLGRTEGEMRYTQIARLGLMQKAIDAYPIITDHLERQPIRLLPFVEASEPAPWFKIRKQRASKRP
ncbi:tyrosine-type recombinase/integrase [Brucella rhizosphaerae]